MNEELYHHGILGQKWGHQNGPPYPLDASDHSASEKKAGYKKSLNSSNESTKKQKPQKTKKELKEHERKKRIAKQALAVGGILAGTVAAGTLAGAGAGALYDFISDTPSKVRDAVIDYVQSDEHYYKDCTGSLRGAVSNGKDWVMNFIYDHS